MSNQVHTYLNPKQDLHPVILYPRLKAFSCRPCCDGAQPSKIWRIFDKSARYNYRYNIMKSKIRKIGNSYGIVLPKKALNAMKVKEGDAVYITEATENSLNITREEADFGRKMEIAEDLMHRYSNALRELAK